MRAASAPVVSCLSLIAGIALCACAGRHPAPVPRDDGRARLVREMDRMKEPSAAAQRDLVEARSVLDALGATQRQGDAGAADQ
jgi:hypothetical protein